MKHIILILSALMLTKTFTATTEKISLDSAEIKEVHGCRFVITGDLDGDSLDEVSA